MPTRPELPPTRALVWLYTPAAQRETFAALCGIEAEISASLNPRIEHQVAHARLAWWGEECARTALGAPTHPLTRALGASLAGADLTALAGLAGFVATARWDLAAATCETRAQLGAYCQRWAHAMITPLVPSTLGAAASRLGATLHEIQLLAHLAAASAAPQDLARPPWPHGLVRVLRLRHQQLRAELAAGVGELPRLNQPTLAGLLVWARLAAAHSQRSERALPHALEPRDHHGPLDSWRAWSTARRAAAGRFAL